MTNKRNQLAVKADGYMRGFEVASKIRSIGDYNEGFKDGRASAQIEMEFVCMTRETDAYQEGREDQKRTQHRYAWIKLFIQSVVASMCGLLIAAAIWAVIT